MPVSQASLEEAVICILAFHNEGAPLLALKIQDYTLFTNKHHQTIAKAALPYIAKYKTCPGVQLDYLLESELKRGTEGQLLRSYLDEYTKLVGEIQLEFILEELDKFLQIQELTRSLERAMESLQQGELDEARSLIYRAVPPVTSGPSEVLLNDPKQSLAFFDRDENNEYYSFGIPTLDKKGIRPDRKTLSFLIAASGLGKTWFLVEVVKTGLQHHHKVLHITLELSPQKTAQRYLQSIFSLTKEEATLVKVPYFQQEADGSSSIKFREFSRESLINKRKELYKKLTEMKSYPPLIIKEFPTSTLTVEQLAMYLESLKRERGFVPDLVLIDYADLMKIDSQALRVDTGRLYRDLRGLAVSRDFALVTATQGNRESEGAKLVGSKNVSEDWSKIGTADGVLTYSQTADERLLGLARIFVAKWRDTADRFIVLCSQCYSIGQFSLNSIMMNAETANEISKAAGNEA